MMIWRISLYFVVLALLVAAAVYLTDNPGRVGVDWQGYRVETTVGILILGLIALVWVAILIYRVLRGLWDAPGAFVHYRRAKRAQRGHLAVTRGMVALAAGDAEEARRQARKATGLLDDRPLTMLLSAQSAQLNGDEAAARRYFTQMLEDDDAAFMGVRGLLNQALRAGDSDEALKLAQKADQLRPNTPWVQATLCDLYVQREDWDKAAQYMAQAIRLKAYPQDSARAKRALIAQRRAATAEEAGDVSSAVAQAKSAVELAPDSPSATAALIRLYGKAGKRTRALKLAEKSWASIPDAEVAQAFLDLKPEASALDQYKRLELLCRTNAKHEQSRLALAEAALHARLWGQVRHHLEPLVADDVADPPPRACRLMAAVEKAERGDLVAAEKWWARAEGVSPDLAEPVLPAPAEDEEPGSADEPEPKPPAEPPQPAVS